MKVNIITTNCEYKLVNDEENKGVRTMNATKDVWRKEIWFCDFGDGVGSEQKGVRPCLIISNDTFNYFSPTVTVMAITSQLKKKTPVHIELPADKYNLERNSIILGETITTISKNRLIKKVIELDDEKMEEVNNIILIQNGVTDIPMPKAVRERKQLAYA